MSKATDAKKTNAKTKRGMKQAEVRPKLTEKQGWILALKLAGLAAWVFVSITTAQFVVSMILYLILRERINEPVWTGVYSVLMYGVALALILFIPLLIKTKWEIKTENGTKKGKTVGSLSSRNLLGLNSWPTWTDIGLAPVAFVVSTLLAVGAAAFFSMFPWFNAGEVQQTGFNLFMNNGERVVGFLTLVVLAPIAEEIIFRGWLYGKLREVLHLKVSEAAAVVVSIVVVSLLFAAVHSNWNVKVNVFCLSVVLCALREVTGTIYAGILTHMIKNGVAFYLLYIMGFGV